MRRAILLAGLMALGGCDDMSVQPKQKAYSPLVGPAKIPSGTVDRRAAVGSRAERSCRGRRRARNGRAWRATGLEWQTSSPPLTENFVVTPTVIETPYNYPPPEVVQHHV